jgi:hypothetical protein
MVEKSSLEEPLRRAMEANLRYYEALGGITQDYVKALLGVFRDMPIRIGKGSGTTAATAKPAAKPANATVSASAATLVLEAAAGSEAQGVFLVENKLSRTVSTAVMMSEFADPSGRAVRPVLRVVPNVVTLEPGGRTLVQIIAEVSGDLETDVPYRGEVSVPGLSDHGIPVMLRRRVEGEAPAAAAKKRSARTGRKSTRSKAKKTKRRTSSRTRKTES